MKIYELVEYTPDDIYYPLGVYESLEKLLDDFDSRDNPKEALSPYAGKRSDLEIFTVYEREMNVFEGYRKAIMKIKRKEMYNEETDELKWITAKAKTLTIK